MKAPFKKKRYLITYELTNTSRRTTVKKNAITDNPERFLIDQNTDENIIVVITFIFEL